MFSNFQRVPNRSWSTITKNVGQVLTLKQNWPNIVENKVLQIEPKVSGIRTRNCRTNMGGMVAAVTWQLGSVYLFHRCRVVCKPKSPLGSSAPMSSSHCCTLPMRKQFGQHLIRSLLLIPVCIPVCFVFYSCSLSRSARQRLFLYYCNMAKAKWTHACIRKSL